MGEIAEWCESLAPCGIKGQLLHALQDAIKREQIDGVAFSDMLKSNSLQCLGISHSNASKSKSNQSLGVQDLNPRQSLAIRKAWNVDFGQVSFVDQYRQQSVPNFSSCSGSNQRSDENRKQSVPKSSSYSGRNRRTDEHGLSSGATRSVQAQAIAREVVAPLDRATDNVKLPTVAKKSASESPRKRRLKATDSVASAKDDSVVRSVKYVPLAQLPRVNQEKPKTFNSLFGTRCPAPRPQVILDD